MDHMFDQTRYETHHFLFIDQIEKELQDRLGNKVSRIEKLGQDILCESSLQETDAILQQLRSTTLFGIESFKNIKLFWKNEHAYALAVFYSFDNNFSCLLKISLHKEDFRNEYNRLLETVARHYPVADFFKMKKLLKKENMDFSLYSQFVPGLDCFDVYGSLDEDRIQKAVIDTSVANIYQKDLLADQNMLKLISLVGAYDFHAGIFPELCLCMGIESMLQMRVTERAKRIRVIICELSRMASHLGNIAVMVEILGYDWLLSRVLAEREKVLHLMEILTGARFLPNFIRVGGVKKDVGKDKIGHIAETLRSTMHHIRGIESSMLENILVFNKLRDTGRITRSMSQAFGLSGPNLRSAGIRRDLRKDKDYLMYEKFSFITPLGRHGTTLDRVNTRFKEIYQSAKIVMQAIKSMPEGEIKKINNLSSFSFPGKAAFSSVECPHGVFQMYLEAKNSQIDTMVVLGPYTNSLMAAEKVLEGSSLEDVDLILASLDISPGEIIRNRWY